MAHEISITVNGSTEAVFGFGEVPWWNSDTLQATVMDRAVSFDEVFSIAFPWTAEMEQLQYADGSLSTQHGIRRSDTLVELGVHSGNYGNIQPRDLFNFCAAFFEESQVPISSAIAMRGGKVLNISARLGEINVLNSGDIHKSYLCFANSFDSTLKALAYISGVQPVCMNTTRAGISSATGKMEYRHSKHVERRIQNDIMNVKSLMADSKATEARLQEVFDKLAQVKPTREAYESILTELFGESTATRSKNTKAQFTDIVANGINAQAYPGFKGTGYGIYTALTDYVDHHQTVRHTDNNADKDVGQIRFERSMIGDGAKLKAKGLEILERVLVLADGSTESKPMVMDMSISNSIPPFGSAVRYTLEPGYVEPAGKPIIDIPVDNTPIWDSLPLDVISQIDEVDQYAPQPEMVTMYTTLDQQDFPAHVSLESIVDTLPSGVTMKLVKCPQCQESSLKTIAERKGCAVFTEAQWQALGK